jgi:hypothetical protein
MAQSLFALSNIDSSEKKQLSEQSRPEVRCSRSSLDSAAIVQNPSQRLLSWTMLALRLIKGKMCQKQGARGGWTNNGTVACRLRLSRHAVPGCRRCIARIAGRPCSAWGGHRNAEVCGTSGVHRVGRAPPLANLLSRKQKQRAGGDRPQQMKTTIQTMVSFRLPA